MDTFLRSTNVTTEDLQIQVLITTIVLGVLILILIAFIIGAFVMILKLRKAIDKLNAADRHNEFRIERVKSPYCFHNPTIQPHEELSRRGFFMYDGSDSTLPNSQFYQNRSMTSEKPKRLTSNSLNTNFRF